MKFSQHVVQLVHFLGLTEASLIKSYIRGLDVDDVPAPRALCREKKVAIEEGAEGCMVRRESASSNLTALRLSGFKRQADAVFKGYSAGDLSLDEAMAAFQLVEAEPRKKLQALAYQAVLNRKVPGARKRTIFAVDFLDRFLVWHPTIPGDLRGFYGIGRVYARLLALGQGDDAVNHPYRLIRKVRSFRA